jgi:hypothetical protein
VTVFQPFSRTCSTLSAPGQSGSRLKSTRFLLLFFLSLLPTEGFSQIINDPATSMIMVNQSEFRKAQEKPIQKNTKEQRPAPVIHKTSQPHPEAKPQETTQDATFEEESVLPEVSESVVDSSGREAVKARAVVVDINSKTLNYDKDHDVYVATGSVHMVISEQNSELFADKLTYDENQSIAIAEGSVIIVKNGQKTHGSYAKIDLTRKSALINDYQTSVSQVRITAKEALVNEQYVQYENGSIIITPALLQEMSGAGAKPAAASSSKKAATSTKQPIKGHLTQHSEGNAYHEEDISAVGITQQEIDDSQNGKALPTETANHKKSLFSFKTKELDIHRYESGYNRIALKHPSVYAKDRKVLNLPGMEFSFDQPTGDTQYLGPDIGYDADYGGFYFGPGWDFRAGDHGSIRFSPLLSYGGGGRRSRGGARFENKGVGAGIGGIVHYRDPRTFLDAGYNSRVGQPVLLADRKLLDGKTHLRLSANEDYINGFIGYERPGYGLMVYDYRNLAKFGEFRLDSNSSVGWFKDEFFPTYDKSFFVDPKAKTPGQGGRAQLQVRLINEEPLLRVGSVLDFGLRADMILSGYTTGDAAGLVRGGPTMSVHLGDRYDGRIQYYYAGSAGDTPFVFDSYYRGRQNVVLANAFKINPYLTLGLRSNMSLQQDNAKGSLFTGNALYMLAGPKEVKVNLAYDVIRKRSYFGLNFYPGSGSKTLDYEKMRIFQPQNYDEPTLP